MSTRPQACPLCGSTVFTHLASIHVEGTAYDRYGCKVCAVEWWEPFRNPGATWYEHDSRYADRNQDPILFPNDKHRGTVAFFGPRVGRVLDIGCGTGNFLAHAEDKGWEGWGIDFDADAIAAGKEALGLTRLEVAEIGEFANAHPDVRFDLVTFFDVIEHLDNHAAFMASVERVLLPDGHIAFSMPYRHGWQWLMPNDLPPRHLTRWDEVATQSFLEQHGYRLLRFKRLPASLYFIVMKLRFRYGAWASFGLVGKVKERAKASTPSGATEGSARQAPIQLLARLAKIKDLLIFGIPALILWLVLLPTRKRYTDSYVIAQRNPN